MLKAFSKYIQHLRGISLFTTPPFLSGYEVPSRFVHSLSAAGLAEHAEENDMAIKIALLFHDIGSMAFNHLTEEFYKEIMGKDHEAIGLERVASLPIDEDLKDEVLDILSGKDRRSKWVNAFMDLDNIDNLWWSYRAFFGRPPYSREALAAAIHANGVEEWAFKRWLAVRRKVYDYLALESRDPNILSIIRKVLSKHKEEIIPSMVFLPDYEFYQMLLRFREPELLQLEMGNIYSRIGWWEMDKRPSHDQLDQWEAEIAERVGAKPFEISSIAIIAPDKKKWRVLFFSRRRVAHADLASVL